MSEVDRLYQLTGLDSNDLADVLAENPRAYMAVKGAVAEKHLEKYLEQLVKNHVIRSFRKANGDFEKDFYVVKPDGSEKIVECKNVQVISITSAAVSREFIEYCLRRSFLERTKIHRSLVQIEPSAKNLTVEAGLKLLNGKKLKELLAGIPQEVRESGLPRYEFSASKLGAIDLRATKEYLRQFQPPLTIDFQRTRNSTDVAGDTKAQRFYRVGEIDIVAACLFSRSLKWAFVFGRHDILERHKKYGDRYTNSLSIDPSSWKDNLVDVL